MASKRHNKMIQKEKKNTSVPYRLSTRRLEELKQVALNRGTSIQAMLDAGIALVEAKPEIKLSRDENDRWRRCLDLILERGRPEIVKLVKDLLEIHGAGLKASSRDVTR